METSNRTVEKTLHILQLISKYSEGITLSEIQRELNLPKATVFDILKALYKEDAIYYKDPNLKTYVIGSKIFAIGQAYTKNSNFINFASPSLKAFANEYELTVFACKRISDKVTYIYKYESAKTKITTFDVGIQLPLHRNTAGKAFLSFLSATKRERLLNEILEREFNGQTAGEYQELLNELVDNKQKGYVLDNGKTEGYICTYAVPVFNFENENVGVICASQIISGLTQEKIQKQLAEFKQIAHEISVKQGYQS